MRHFPRDISAYIAGRLHELLPPVALKVLQTAARIASGHGWQIYLVGGYVRDCLLKIPDYDIDVSIEGDAPLLAREVAEQTGARLELHPGFGTAVLIFEGGQFDMDVVTARREWYDRPGALPSVAAGTIQDDLARRDFTVNAMAVRITPDGFGPFLDPQRGLADLRQELIHVLHSRSFLDDPTRIFRAVKLAHRLGFEIEPGTLALIEQAIRDGALSTVSMDRITREMLLILEEPRGAAILAELDTLGVLAAVHPALSWGPREVAAAPSEHESISREDRRDACLAIIGRGMASHAPPNVAATPAQAEALARFLKLATPQIRLMRDVARLASLQSRLEDKELKAADVHNLLHGLDPAALEAFARIMGGGRGGSAWLRLRDYLDRLRYIRPSVNGHYLRQVGVPPGPVYQRVLEALLDAKLNGELPARDDEERFVKSWLEKHT